MACFRPLVLACTLLSPGVIVGCSDDGDPQDADDGVGTETEGNSATVGGSDPTITTTASTSLTNGTSDSSNDGAEATGATASDTGGGGSTGAADGDDAADSSGGTGAGETTGATDPTGMSESSSGDAGTTGAGATPVGSECTEDGECTTGVCWDWSDYDPFCFGAVCSGECASDEECIDLATDAAAPYPENATCGEDGLCVFLESGLGAWACQ